MVDAWPCSLVSCEECSWNGLEPFVYWRSNIKNITKLFFVQHQFFHTNQKYFLLLMKVETYIATCILLSANYQSTYILPVYIDICTCTVGAKAQQQCLIFCDAAGIAVSALRPYVGRPLSAAAPSWPFSVSKTSGPSATLTLSVNVGSTGPNCRPNDRRQYAGVNYNPSSMGTFGCKSLALNVTRTHATDSTCLSVYGVMIET